jgi:hypothetical protein
MLQGDLEINDGQNSSSMRQVDLVVK